MKKLTKNISEFYLNILKKIDQKYFRILFEDFEKQSTKNISEIYLKILKKQIDQKYFRNCFSIFLSLVFCIKIRDLFCVCGYRVST